MATALYVVIQSRGKWYVDFEGKGHGPFETREAAALEGKQLAEFSSHMGRASEVLVPDKDGKYWVVWDSRDVRAGVPRPLTPPRESTPALAAEPQPRQKDAA
jgi:hypothetical protein